MHQNRWRLGLRPRPHWESLQRSPRPPSWIQWVLLLRLLLLRGGESRGGEGGGGLPRLEITSGYALGFNVINVRSPNGPDIILMKFRINTTRVIGQYSLNSIQPTIQPRIQ